VESDYSVLVGTGYNGVSMRISKFNDGKPYHGSKAVTGGRLRGATDTDYFYFFCPHCAGDEILRVLDYEVRYCSPENDYDNEISPKAASAFVLAMKLYCESCQHTDFVKISNVGWQGGQHLDALKAIRVI